MRRRRPDADGTDAGRDGQDTRSLVLAAARSVRERLDQFPPVDALVEDGEFLEASEHLEAEEVPQELVERIARSSDAVAAAMAHRALARRDAVSDEWLAWAFRRLKQAYAGELFFLLEAVRRAGGPPLVAPRRARAHDGRAPGLWARR